jgi:hypothetical protein
VGHGAVGIKGGHFDFLLRSAHFESIGLSMSHIGLAICQNKRRYNSPAMRNLHGFADA